MSTFPSSYSSSFVNNLPQTSVDDSPSQHFEQFVTLDGTARDANYGGEYPQQGRLDQQDQQQQQMDEIGGSPDSGAGTLTDEEENSQKASSRATTMPQGQRPMASRVVERPSACVVCGKAASCCHFDVPSCLGCRSFFRRSVLSQKQYACQQGGQCRLQVPTTNDGRYSGLCRACRFDRCILGGMNLRAIKSFAERSDLQQLAMDLELRRKELLALEGGGEAGNKPEAVEGHQQCQEVVALPGESYGTIGHINGNIDAGTKLATQLNSLLYIDERLLRIRYSETTSAFHDFYSLQSLLSMLESSQNFLARSEQFSARPMQALSVQLHQSQLGTPEGHGKGCKPKWLFVDSFLCLEMIKTLPAIQQLSAEAKISLLSSNALAAIVFSQHFYTLMAHNEVFTFPDGFSPLCFFEPVEKVGAMKRKLFCENLEPFKLIRMSREEFLLLRVILFLQPGPFDLPKLDQAIVDSALEEYTKMLMEYERQRLGNPAGVQRFAELVFFLQFVLNVGNQHRTLLMNLMLLQGNLSLLQHPDFMDNVMLGVSRK